MIPLHLDGGGLTAPLTAARGFTSWEFEPWVAAGLVLAAGLYLLGVRRLRLRGDHWPIGRTVSFVVLGLGTLGVATMSSLGVYDDTLFWMHMVQHMLLQMVAPVFLALGAPITLALRTGSPRVRGGLLTFLHSRVARVLAWPPVGAAVFACLPFVLYFTGWYEATLTHQWLHYLQHLLFIAAGCMFTWPLIGIDPIPNRASYPWRLMTAFLILPAHAILGITIMQGTTPIAANYYLGLGRTWGPTLAGDQNIGGGILWASGDLLGLLFFAVLFVQWVRAEDRETARVDRALDRVDNSLDAYNAMLARLAEHDLQQR
jgi:cytochrome c oxidase assembly factor CtaG